MRGSPFGKNDALFPALDAERIDIIANQVTINPEREARYLFSEPYTYSRGVIVTAKDDDSITTLSDLEGKTTAPGTAPAAAAGRRGAAPHRRRRTSLTSSTPTGATSEAARAMPSTRKDSARPGTTKTQLSASPHEP